MGKYRPDRCVCISFTEGELEHFVSISTKTYWKIINIELDKGFAKLQDLPEAEFSSVKQKNSKPKTIDFPVSTWRKIVHVSRKMKLTPTQFVHRLLIARHFPDMLNKAICELNSEHHKNIIVQK